MADSSQQLQMQRAAEAAVRRWPELDGTLESLELVEGVVTDEDVSDQELQVLAAYVGELVRQHAGNGRWRVSRLRLQEASPGPVGVLKFRHYEFDPYDLLANLAEPLAELIDTTIAFGRSPSKRTINALDLRAVPIEYEDPPGPWTEMRQDLAFLRARLSDWWLRRREHRAEAR